MPDWSPVRRFGGYAAWGDREGAPLQATLIRRNACGCTQRCGVHGHAHARASCAPVTDLRSLWGALGCSCWAG